MKAVTPSVDPRRPVPLDRGLPPRKLVARTAYPTVSIPRFHNGRLAKLAWIFGFGR